MGTQFVFNKGNFVETKYAFHKKCFNKKEQFRKVLMRTILGKTQIQIYNMYVYIICEGKIHRIKNCALWVVGWIKGVKEGVEMAATL